MACVWVVVLDVAQPLLWPWQPALWGAVGGAAIYAAVFTGVRLDRRWALWLAAAMPAIPLANLALWALTGGGVPPRPMMFAVLAGQLVASVAAIRALARS